jgi:mono/diheme cytochrome c family protein
VLILAFVLIGVACYIFFFIGKRPHVDEGHGKVAPGDGKQQAVSGQELYAGNCAGCHGEKGDGKGPAARFLYPRPRDFGEAKFRLVSTSNMLPSDEDLKRVIRQGMPGSAMFAFEHLGDEAVDKLVKQVRHLIRQGIEDRLRQSAAANGEKLEPAMLTETLDELTRLGDPVSVPARFPEATKESIARGGELFRDTKTACSACHGPLGKGDGSQDQRNDDGMPTRPRDLTRGIFKSGRDRGQLYIRIVRGLPGSPMSSNNVLKPDEIGDIINYILSLSPEEATARTQHRRRILTAGRVEALPADPSDAAWQAAKTANVVVTPLWWRDYPEPDLKVSALHDGKALAIRLSWHDPTRNDHAVRPQDFEDMAAVQLFKGRPEPFLGMGASGKALDVWLWRAGWSGKPGESPDVDSVYPNMAVDAYPFEKQGDAKRPHATDRQEKGFLTAYAAGNALADPSRGLTAGNLAARGIGTLTMRPRASQAVTASASWKEGRWTVVLRRPLVVGADNGLPLAPADKISVAFALWDGAARDRNGQKLVSIWHDLTIEK